MDGENKGKPYEQMDDLVAFTIISGYTYMLIGNSQFSSKNLAKLDQDIRSFGTPVFFNHRWVHPPTQQNTTLNMYGPDINVDFEPGNQEIWLVCNEFCL